MKIHVDGIIELEATDPKGLCNPTSPKPQAPGKVPAGPVVSPNPFIPKGVDILEPKVWEKNWNSAVAGHTAEPPGSGDWGIGTTAIFRAGDSLRAEALRKAVSEDDNKNRKYVR